MVKFKFIILGLFDRYRIDAVRFITIGHALNYQQKPSTQKPINTCFQFYMSIKMWKWTLHTLWKYWRLNFIILNKSGHRIPLKIGQLIVCTDFVMNWECYEFDSIYPNVTNTCTHVPEWHINLPFSHDLPGGEYLLWTNVIVMPALFNIPNILNMH